MCASPPLFHFILWSWKVSGKWITREEKGDGKAAVRKYYCRNWLLMYVKTIQGVFSYEKMKIPCKWWPFYTSLCMFISSCPIIIVFYYCMFMSHWDRHLKTLYCSRLYLINLFVRNAVIKFRSSCYPRYLHLSRMLGTSFSKFLNPFFLDLVDG